MSRSRLSDEELTEAFQMYCGYKCRCGQVAHKTCGKCKLRRYCSTECQKQDWSLHKHKCRPYSPDEPSSLDALKFRRKLMGQPTMATLDKMAEKHPFLPYQDSPWYTVLSLSLLGTIADLKHYLIKVPITDFREAPPGSVKSWFRDLKQRDHQVYTFLLPECFHPWALYIITATISRRVKGRKDLPLPVRACFDASGRVALSAPDHAEQAALFGEIMQEDLDRLECKMSRVEMLTCFGQLPLVKRKSNK